MGEIAEMMTDGTMCEMCGVFLDGDSPGFPRYCSPECAADRGAGPAQVVGGGHTKRRNNKRKKEQNRG